MSRFSLNILPSLFEGLEAVEWWVKNPLLVRHCPERLAEVTAGLIAGTYTPADLLNVARDLRRLRDRLHHGNPSESGLISWSEQPVWLLLMEALRDAEVRPGELSNVRAFGFTLRPSELHWLLHRVRLVIDRRRAGLHHEPAPHDAFHQYA